MKKIFFLIFSIFIVLPIQAKTEIDKAFIKRDVNVSKKFTLYSPDIYDNKQIREEQVFDGFDCDGQNLSPKLVWKNIPEGTKSFAITMYNKDAKTGSGWWHWVIYNIPNDTNSIEDNASRNKKFMPKGSIEGVNDYGEYGYGGVCPPIGVKQKFIITIYALNIEKIDLPKKASAAMIGLYLNDYKIGTATISAFYKREGDSKIFILNKNNNK